MMQRKMKRITDITKIDSKTVQVEYFDGAINDYNYAIRRVYYPSEKTYSGAYINWFGNKKIVESVME